MLSALALPQGTPMHTENPAPPSTAMLSALSILKGEHASFAIALKTLVGHLDFAREHAFIPKLEIFATGLNYINTFIDQFHHPKEDEFLFRLLRQRTSEADEVLFELQFDHAHAASAFKELKSALDRAQVGGATDFHEFADAMQEYSRAQFVHLEGEEGIVIPLARRVLVEEEWQEIDRGFRANRDPLFGAEQKSKFGVLFRPGEKNSG
jgi:hemerythrin-like domain-containing protein